MNDSIIECDKCGSQNVTRRLLNPTFPKKKIIKISEYPPQRLGMAVQNANIVYHQYKLICNNCGYEGKEFTQ